jgi:hypothetical protein
MARQDALLCPSIGPPHSDVAVEVFRRGQVFPVRAVSDPADHDAPRDCGHGHQGALGGFHPLHSVSGLVADGQGPRQVEGFLLVEVLRAGRRGLFYDDQGLALFLLGLGEFSGSLRFRLVQERLVGDPLRISFLTNRLQLSIVSPVGFSPCLLDRERRHHGDNCDEGQGCRAGLHPGPMPAAPAPQPSRWRLGVRCHRLIGHPPLQVFRQPPR